MRELWLGLLLVAWWQQQMPPPPPPPPPPSQMTRDSATTVEKKGTAVIKGHVRATDGRPLRRARISIRGASLTNARTASTGLEGEYELADLPAGRFTLAASRSGYLPAQY